MVDDQKRAPSVVGVDKVRTRYNRCHNIPGTTCTLPYHCAQTTLPLKSPALSKKLLIIARAQTVTNQRLERK